MKRFLMVASASAILIASPVAAQTGSPGTGNPAGMTPGTQAAPGVPAPRETNPSDRTFVQQATLGGMAEVELGKLAAQRGHSDHVKQFGQRMVKDHGEANDRLSRLAKEAGIAQPDALDPSHKDMQDRLSKMSGAAFDDAYIRGQVSDHQMTAQLFEYEIASGQDEALKRFATETLPIILEHLEMAKDIQAQIAGQALQASAAPGTAEPRSGTNPQ